MRRPLLALAVALLLSCSSPTEPEVIPNLWTVERFDMINGEGIAYLRTPQATVYVVYARDLPEGVEVGSRLAVHFAR